MTPSTPTLDPAPSRAMTAHWTLRSFRSQVALMFASLAIVLTATLALGLGWMFAEKSRASEVADLRGIADNAAHLLADGLAMRSREVESLAELPTVWSDGVGAERVRLMLQRIKAITPHSAWIGVATVDGIVQVAADNLLVGQSVAERPWFKAGLQSTHLGDLHPAKLLAAMLPPARDGAMPRFVDFASPIRQGGRLLGVIGLHGSWDWAHSVVESLLPANAAARRLEVFVLDRTGHVIYASTPGDLQRWDKTGFDTDPATGERFLRVNVRMRGAALPDDLGWSVVAREPESTALAGARDALSRALAFAVLAAAGACALGWAFATRMTRPLSEIALAASAVEAGREGATIPVLTGNPELAQLSSALARMTTQLQGANQELEARVLERTAALEQANRELDRQTRTDPLTGLLNRRGLDDEFGRALASARRRHADFSVLMIDIDHFKRINDTHGHDIGDLALKALATALQARLRETDRVARFGGEEFAVLLPDTDGRQARLVAEALVATVRALPIEPVGRITISCGVAQVILRADTAQSALARADEALYLAKHQGRDRAVTSHGVELETV